MEKSKKSQCVAGKTTAYVKSMWARHTPKDEPKKRNKDRTGYDIAGTHAVA